MLKDCVVPGVKHNGGSVMIWNGFGGSKVGDKRDHEKRLQLNFTKACNSIWLKNYWKNSILQQDNDPNMCQSYAKIILIINR